MKIAYIGNFTQRHCTEVHLAATLRSLGHTVVEIQENEINGGLLNKINGTDLVLYTRTWGNYVTLDDLESIRLLGIPTASYHLDLYIGLARKYLHENKSIDQILQTDPFWRTDYVFTPDGDPDSQKVFEANGVNHYYMKPGVYKPECYSAPSEDKKYDVLFVGGGDRPGSPDGYGHPEWPYRDELIGWLYDTYGTRFTKFGHPQKTIRNEELNQLYADTKIVVGDSVCLGFQHQNYWSDRVYETIGRGGFLIHPYIKGLDDEFTDGQDIVFYEFGNFKQLKEKIDYYLEHDNERNYIRQAGQALVKANCTYTERLKQALGIITGERKPTIEDNEPIKINLGAGREPAEGWVNVDWIAGEGIDVIHNLTKYPYPFTDEVASEIKAIDLMEHLPPHDNIKFIEECWRILQPGGKLFITVPHWQSKNAMIDPTHYRGFDEKSLDYFDPTTDFGTWYGYYSDYKFKVKSVRTPNDNVEYRMEKI